MGASAAHSIRDRYPNACGLGNSGHPRNTPAEAQPNHRAPFRRVSGGKDRRPRVLGQGLGGTKNPNLLLPVCGLTPWEGAAMANQEQGSNQGRDQKQGTQTAGQDWDNRNRTDAESTSGTQRSSSTDAESTSGTKTGIAGSST